MRRLVVLLSALMFAFAMNGEALAKDKKAKPTDADKQAQKEHAQQHKAQKADADKSTPLMRFHASNSKPDSSWLHGKGYKGY